MTKIQEQIQKIKSYLQGKVTSETPADELAELNGIIEACDDVVAEDTKTNDELVKTKDMVIKMVKNQGSSTSPEDPAGGDKPPRSLEEIAQEVISKR